MVSYYVINSENEDRVMVNQLLLLLLDIYITLISSQYNINAISNIRMDTDIVSAIINRLVIVILINVHQKYFSLNRGSWSLQ